MEVDMMSMPLHIGLGMSMQQRLLRDRGFVLDGNRFPSDGRVVGRRKAGRVLARQTSRDLRDRRLQNVDGEFYVGRIPMYLFDRTETWLFFLFSVLVTTYCV
ncbi:hypothetical protein Droror1_Dr00019632 [Drosera rotundifolia]